MRIKTLIILAVVTGALYYGYTKYFPAAGQAQPMGGAPVSVATVITKDVTLWHEFSGRLEAVDSVQIKPRVSGTIEAIHFKDGDTVTKDQLLFTIDPRPYEAALTQAEAALSSAQNDAQFARVELVRAQKLIKDRVVTKSDFDNRQARSRVADSNVKSAQAAVDVAKLNLGYTAIKAPITGRISRAEVTVGNLVETQMGAPMLASIVSQDPIYVGFEADEQTLLHFVQKTGMNNVGQVPVLVGLASDTEPTIKGFLHSIDNQLNVASGTIRVRAKLDNKEGKLVPGLFATVRMGSATPEPAVLISDRAIGTDQDKKFVLVVGSDNKAQYREVKLGMQVDGLRMVTSGLKGDETLVVNGLQRVRPGDMVTPEMVPMDPRQETPADSDKSPAAPVAEEKK